MYSPNGSKSQKKLDNQFLMAVQNEMLQPQHLQNQQMKSLFLPAHYINGTPCTPTRIVVEFDVIFEVLCDKMLQFEL